MREKIVTLINLNNALHSEFGITPMTDSEIKTLRAMYLFEMTGKTKEELDKLPNSEFTSINKVVEQNLYYMVAELKKEVLGGNK